MLNLLQVRSLSFWMKNFGHPTPKRTTVLSNSSSIGALATDKLDKSKPTLLQTTQKYKNRAGQERWHGTRELKETQPLAHNNII